MAALEAIKLITGAGAPLTGRLMLYDGLAGNSRVVKIAADPAYRAYDEDLRRRGAMLGGARLRPVADATTVRVRGGETLVSDGPFAETKEALGGYYLIEAADLDTAVASAKQVPAPGGGVEVRPVMSFD